MKPLLKPGILLAAVVVVLQTGLVSPHVALVTSAFYGLLIAGLLLAWRFHSTRIFSALLVVFLAQQAILYFSSGSLTNSAPGRMAIASVGVLLPLNFILLSFRQEKGFVFSSLAPLGLWLFVQSVIVAVLCRPEPTAHHALHSSALPVHLPFATLLAFAAAGIILLARFFLLHRTVECGLLWSLAASFLALHSGALGRIPTAYFATAAFILASAVVETSYQLAYHDELTTLPSRRSFNDALLRLQAPYSIAMADIDHFKRCNDTYGHDVGDQVLRMVASRLGRVSGGGQAYRCGGEEFAIIFPGKTTVEVVEHLEKLRADIQASELRLRGADRRQEIRGPDRRNQRRASRGRAIRQLAQPVAQDVLSVTISIGVATANVDSAPVEEIIQAADKALYRAKSAGRNRVESASSLRRRVRGKAAGIA